MIHVEKLDEAEFLRIIAPMQVHKNTAALFPVMTLTENSGHEGQSKTVIAPKSLTVDEYSECTIAFEVNERDKNSRNTILTDSA